MTGTLKVTPEELREYGCGLCFLRQRVKNNTAQMLTLVAGISQSVWSGASSASYLNKFQALRADIEKINKMLQEQVNDLTAMAEEYERAEQEAQTAASALKNNIVG